MSLYCWCELIFIVSLFIWINLKPLCRASVSFFIYFKQIHAFIRICYIKSFIICDICNFNIIYTNIFKCMKKNFWQSLLQTSITESILWMSSSSNWYSFTTYKSFPFIFWKQIYWKKNLFQKKIWYSIPWLTFSFIYKTWFIIKYR